MPRSTILGFTFLTRLQTKLSLFRRPVMSREFSREPTSSVVFTRHRQMRLCGEHAI